MNSVLDRHWFLKWENIKIHVKIYFRVSNKTMYSSNIRKGLSWSWSYGSWIYNYLCNQCLSPLTLRVRIPFMQGVLNTTLCVKVCQWLAAGRWFSPGTPVSSTNKTDRHDITEILLKVALNTITITLSLEKQGQCKAWRIPSPKNLTLTFDLENQ